LESVKEMREIFPFEKPAPLRRGGKEDVIETILKTNFIFRIKNYII
jgi:hypothetical protein